MLKNVTATSVYLQAMPVTPNRNASVCIVMVPLGEADLEDRTDVGNLSHQIDGLKRPFA